MKTTTGVITLAQEHRFQLVDDQGRNKLFILAHGAPVQGRDLTRLAESQCDVTVFYTEANLRNAYTAHDVHEQMPDASTSANDN
jgi:hypothetical protein